MDATIYRVIVPTKDFKVGVAFYASLFGQPGERVSPNRHYFRCGPVILAVVGHEHLGAAFQPNPEWIYLSVADLEEAFARSKAAGAMVEEEIASHPWGEHSFYVRDPSGNGLCFVEGQTEFTGGRYVP